MCMATLVVSRLRLLSWLDYELQVCVDCNCNNSAVKKRSDRAARRDCRNLFGMAD
ncbi:hypothetical protein M758_1G140600 [Ceratodon purpureus]|nr:hypothetical protein M758_1G140600 [Ceratodon purpureus]